MKLSRDYHNGYFAGLIAGFAIGVGVFTFGLIMTVVIVFNL